MTPIVDIVGLSHRYTNRWAVHNLSFSIERNGVLGLLGSNGAGKSTTMNILCGVIRQTEGHVLINGIDMSVHPEKAKQLIGFLPQSAPLHLDFTVDEYLIYCAQLRQVARKEIQKALAQVKSICGLEAYGRRLIRNLSGGYRQRVGIAQAIIHNPRVVILDEPTNGLDPNQITAVRHLINEIASERAVILSSHILQEVEATCQDIRMIEKGELVFSGTMQEFYSYFKTQRLLVTFSNPPEITELKKISGINHVETLPDGVMRIVSTGDTDLGERIAMVSVQNGWGLRRLQSDKPRLEEIFAYLSTQSKRS